MLSQTAAQTAQAASVAPTGTLATSPTNLRVAKFAFLVHPLATRQLFNHPALRYLRPLPERLVERLASLGGPLRISSVTGARSATGVAVEGSLYALTSTPRMLMSIDPRVTYAKILKVARWAEESGAGILGLGAFTSVVGDAGITIAREANIAITSGNSYAVASTLEVAKVACRAMGLEPEDASVMVIGATGSIGSACCRLVAKVARRLHMVAPRPEKLLQLRARIAAESPRCELTIRSTSEDHTPDADVIITATTSRGGQLLDIMRVKPGCVICDVARPLDIREEDAARRPDVLVIESGELVVPGAVEFGANIGLPSRTAYACLSETMILAMEGRFEDYSLGRDLPIESVKEIYKLGKKHGFRLAPIHSFGRVVTPADIERVREFAQRARRCAISVPAAALRPAA